MKKFYFMIFAVVTLAGMLAISGCKKKETYTVTFNANGGTGTMAAQTFTEGEAQALTRNAFTYDGYTFTGWNTLQGGSGASYTDGQTITATADMTLYAQWSANTVTVTFNANGGTGEMAPQTFTIGTPQALNANTFTRENYNYLNWNTAADGSGTIYENSQEITVSEGMTLYAQWEIITYTVTFESNGGTGDMPAQTFNAGESQSIATNVFTRDNYWFVGWNTTADGTGTSYNDRQSITVTEDITLYAKWSLGMTGNTTGHNYVDLGLPSGTKWATCNVGASTPIAYGDYFAWGETTAKETYNWDTYRYYDGSNLTKYTGSDNLTTLEASDDAATANWGSGWRMPTAEEFDELQNNCTVIWTTQNGVNGRLFTGSNGNSIFLPAAGYRYDSELGYAGSCGDYWSSSLSSDDTDRAWDLYFYSGYSYMYTDGYRFFGLAVRAVCQSQN
jgi:uncharacterized repeat protein (TIGR02543 family)